MTLNTSGPISLGGSTAGQSVNLQLGYSATATISMNDAAVRTLTGTTAGTAITMPTAFYGKPTGTNTVTLTVTANIKNLNVFSAVTSPPSGVTKTGTYSAGSTVNVVVNSGIVIGSTSVSTYSFDTGTGWSGSDILTLTNNGYIAGASGAGGHATTVAATGVNGGAGGISMHVQKALSITNASGYIYSGGGGGGGGGGANGSPGGAGGGGAGSVHPAAGGSVAIVNYGINFTHGGNGAFVGVGPNGLGAPLNFNGGDGHGSAAGVGDGGGGGGGGRSGGKGGGGNGGFFSNGGGHGAAITGISLVTFISGNTRVYGGTI